MTCQITWRFVDSGGHGWTESYYAAGDDPAQLRTSTVRIADARLGILAKGNFLQEIRISNVAIFRDAEPLTYSSAEGEGKFGAGAAFPSGGNEQAWDRLLLRIIAGTTKRRNLELGGIPRTVISQGGFYQGPPAWIGPFDNWKRQVLTNPGRIQLKTFKLATPMLPVKSARTTVSNPKAVILTLTTANKDALAVAKGQYVRLGRSHGISAYQGVWKVDENPVANGPDWDVLLQQRRLLVGFPFSGADYGFVGRMQDAPTYENHTDIIPVRGARRKTGRPSGVPAGITPIRGR